jgi:CRP/FNR family transcriptional regulator
VKTRHIDCANCKNKEMSIFCHLGQADLRAVSENKTTNTLKRGQILFYEGNPTFGVYCIANGKLKLSRASEGGRETIIRIVGPGDFVGIQTLLKGGLNEVTATAIEETSVCLIDQSHIQDLLTHNNACAMEVLTHLSHDLSSLQERINGFQSKSVRERVAYILLDFANRYGVDTQDGLRLGIHLSREEYAGLLGIATETFIREISLLKQEGVIDQEGKAIVILKRQVLENTVEND